MQHAARRAMVLIAAASVLLHAAPAHASTLAVPVTLGALTTSGWSAARLTVAAGVRLVGVRWRGDAAAVIEVRVATPTIGGWVRLDPAVTNGGVSASDPVWIGNVTSVDLRVRGGVSTATILLVAPGPQPRVAAAARFAAATTTSAAGVPQPVILSRTAWGADESIRRGQPFLFTRLGVVFIHHTDSANRYAASDVPAMIRGIYTYHVLNNGWHDIGYNYLIDAYGRIWEGRYGGITANVRGAHTEGFNTGSSGIALIGTYMTQAPTTAQLDALERLIGWRLDIAHIDPASRASLVSGGTAKYAADGVVAFNIISGHRDANYTDCPGDVVYADLPRIRRAVASEPYLRIVNPIVAPTTLDPAVGALPVVFRATLSQPATWQLTVRDASGATRFVATGAGRTIHVVWNGASTAAARPAPLASLSWQIEASTPTSNARPATGLFDDSATPAATGTITRVTPTPGVLSPATAAGDAAGVLAWSQQRGASVSVAVTSSDGSLVAVLDEPHYSSAGSHQAAWNGRDSQSLPVVSGHYQYVLRIAQPDGIATITTPVDVRRGVAALRASPGVVRSRRVAAITITAVRVASVPLKLRLTQPSGVRVVAQLPAASGPVSVTIPTQPLADGRYTLSAIAWTAGGLQRLNVSILVDTNPPVVAWLTATRTNGRVVVRGVISRDATLTIRVGRRRVARVAVRHGRILIRLGQLVAANRTSLLVVVGDRFGINQPPITLLIHRSS